MKILGIIAEYNPFHNGHKYHLETAKKIHRPDGIVAVMSPSFTQRGEPAVVDKRSRGEIPVREGVNLLLELPFRGAVASAQDFALAALSILREVPCNILSFGSETFRTGEEIYTLAKKIKEVKEGDSIKTYLSQGYSFHRALLEAAKGTGIEKIGGPNDLLALEYAQSSIELNYPVVLSPIQRRGPGHGESGSKGGFSSGKEIRSRCRTVGEASCTELVPHETLNMLISFHKKNGGFPEFNDLLPLFQWMLLNRKDYEHYYGYEPGLENYLSDFILEKNTSDLKSSKRYSVNRLQRFLLHSLLNIDKESINHREIGTYYLRPLAMDDIGRKILREMKYRNKKIITRPAEVLKKGHKKTRILLKEEILAENLYELITEKNFNSDFRRPPVILTDKISD